MDIVHKGFKDFAAMEVLVHCLWDEEKYDKAEDLLIDIEKWFPDKKGKIKLPERPKDNRDISGGENDTNGSAA